MPVCYKLLFIFDIVFRNTSASRILSLVVGVCWMRVRNLVPAVNSLSGNIRRIFQYLDPPEIYLIYSSLYNFLILS